MGEENGKRIVLSTQQKIEFEPKVDFLVAVGTALSTMGSGCPCSCQISFSVPKVGSSFILINQLPPSRKCVTLSIGTTIYQRHQKSMYGMWV